MDILTEWWGAIMAIVALGVWLVRLEASSKTALREIERLDNLIERDRAATLEARKEQNEMLREMRSDIKRLLERGRT